LSSSNQHTAKIPVLVIFAPTATGKTALLRTLFAEGSPSRFKGLAEVISADSMQVYRGMNIGTAKPDEKLLKELPHHLIDICSPHSQFSAADFVEKADEACSSIYRCGKIPVVAGGTGFYIRSFLLGLPSTPEADMAIRAELAERMEREGAERLYAELQACDPESAAVINVHDKYRIQRALEVYRTTGKPRSSFQMNQTLRTRYTFCTLILTMPRILLNERINSRVDMMFEEGLEREVLNLKKNGCTADDPGMKAIGYREWFSSDSAETVRERIKADSRAYAKKQYTYIRNIPGAAVIPYDGTDAAIQLAGEKINTFALDVMIFLSDNY
jgi:tRNA dimethylallyltransferase